MSNEADYRKSAAESMKLASRAATVADRSRLLLLAERRIELADRAHRLAVSAALAVRVARFPKKSTDPMRHMRG